MVQHSSLDEVFHALADPTRRAMLHRLASGQQNISELAAPFDMSFASVSKHLRVLENSGLVSRQVEGRTHLFQIQPRPLAEADRWLRFYENLWNEQLDALEAMLEAENANQANSTRTSKGKRKGKA